jgi:hypothetical protein
MIGRSHQRGDSNLGCLIWAVLLVLLALVLYKTIPVKYATAQLYDYMEDQSHFRTGKQSAEQIKKRILDKARELDLPLSPKLLSVEIRNDRIKIAATYTVPLEFPLYTYQWTFHQELDRAIYYV